jgi:hypothetical protein
MFLKTILISPFFILMFFFVEAQKNRLQKIRVISVDFSIYPIKDISCSEFDSVFSRNTYKIKEIKDSFQLKDFELALEKVQFNKQKNNINVKAKLYLYYDGQMRYKQLCISKFYKIELDGVPILKSELLIEQIKKVLDK